MEIISYLTNIKEDLEELSQKEELKSTPLLKTLSSQLGIAVDHLKKTAHNSDYTICEECGEKDDVVIEKVCNNCYAEVTISHIT